MSLFFCQFPFLYLFFKLVDGNRLIIDRWYYIWSGNLSDFNLSQGKIILFNFLLKSIHKFLLKIFKADASFVLNFFVFLFEKVSSIGLPEFLKFSKTKNPSDF